MTSTAHMQEAGTEKENMVTEIKSMSATTMKTIHQTIQLELKLVRPLIIILTMK